MGANGLWSIAAPALLLGGVVVVVWALLGDPARGRRRCPRCWYELSSAPLGQPCPECGQATMKERHLRRARRRWRLAGVGVLMIGGVLVEHVARLGWIR